MRVAPSTFQVVYNYATFIALFLSFASYQKKLMFASPISHLQGDERLKVWLPSFAVAVGRWETGEKHDIETNMILD